MNMNYNELDIADIFGKNNLKNIINIFCFIFLFFMIYRIYETIISMIGYILLIIVFLFILKWNMKITWTTIQQHLFFQRGVKMMGIMIRYFFKSIQQLETMLIIQNSDELSL